MNSKSPRKLKEDLKAARQKIELLIAVLDGNAAASDGGLGSECAHAASALRALLFENEIPENYTVAVIGRFKAGKSSFVNELLGRRLAGEQTSPETAAVTTFAYGSKVRATINLIDRNVWSELKEAYSKDPTDPEAHRLSNWFKFADGQEPFDLDELERTHVKPGGSKLVFELVLSSDEKEQKRRESDFRESVKQFTSSTKPHHCLVEAIEIETPSPVLAEGVVLIDTPGLDDTERFRVQLTERAVQDVDAVLFLTKSGASYGQSEKDFLLSLLRKGTVKQLMFVVTQVDHTYEQHVNQSEFDDESPASISTRIESERRRIRTEVEQTLNELTSDGNSTSAQRFREQLDAVPISFTSVTNHRMWMKGKEVKFPISADDPGGMEGVKRSLFTILSTESRLADARHNIRVGTELVVQKLGSIVESRRNAVRGLRNKEMAEAKLSTFRSEFQQNGAEFEDLISLDIDVLKVSLANRSAVEQLAAENIALQADVVLAAYETIDSARHWKTRRGGNWGLLQQLQSRIANAVFPRVAEQLNAQTNQFSSFIDRFRSHLRTMSQKAQTIVERLEIGDDFVFDMEGSLRDFLGETLVSLQTLVAGEEGRIIALLEEFVDEEVEGKIADARARVAGIWGRGTTNAQTAEVRSFYIEVRKILREALVSHVTNRFEEFSSHLTGEAEALPARAIAEVKMQIERASADIRAAAEAALAGRKEAFERAAGELAAKLSSTQRELDSLFDGALIAAQMETLSESDAEEIDSTNNGVNGDIDAADVSAIRKRASKCVDRFTLRNGQAGWPYSKIFRADYVRGAVEVWLIDPYLSAHHQRRNLKEFIACLLDAEKIKVVNIVTILGDEGVGQQEKVFFDQLDRDVFSQFGTRINVVSDSELHDRFVVFDHGVVFKLGRGLDIYKPATGLSSVNSNLRRVRECEIDVFVYAADSRESIDLNRPGTSGGGVSPANY